MLSAGSGHHPAKHLFCTSCSNEGRTVWLYNYQSAVNHFEERHGVKVGKRGPGRRKEVVKGRGKRERGVAWEAPVADEVQEEEQGQQGQFCAGWCGEERILLANPVLFVSKKVRPSPPPPHDAPRSPPPTSCSSRPHPRSPIPSRSTTSSPPETDTIFPRNG